MQENKPLKGILINVVHFHATSARLYHTGSWSSRRKVGSNAGSGGCDRGGRRLLGEKKRMFSLDMKNLPCCSKCEVAITT